MKIMKLLKIILTYVKNSFSENYKTSLRETKEYGLNGETYYTLGSRD